MWAIQSVRRWSTIGLLFGIFLILIFSGCSRSGGEAALAYNNEPPAEKNPWPNTLTCPKLGEIDPIALFAALPDRTGSHLEGPVTTQLIKQELIAQVKRLDPGTQVFIHFISGQTYSNRETLIQDVIPFAPTANDCKVNNPFDPREVSRCKLAKEQQKTQWACVEAAQSRISQAIDQMNPDTALTTDIAGGFLLVDELFRAYGHVAKTLWIASDFQDNVGVPVTRDMTGYHGAKVLFRTTLGGNPQRLRREVKNWEERIMRWGGSVKSLPLGIPIPTKAAGPVGLDTIENS